uniref:meprin A subunit alpha-like n=1 Tax=Myxine glutinosa TaxID=7769 RepID=UPI00358FD493
MPLIEADIAVELDRNAIGNESYFWKLPIPYILGDGLGLNAKAIILQTFEHFRLKTCIDFKPYDGDGAFLHLQKLDGCWSFIGRIGGGQNLSIGERCDSAAVVQHELLHALGFFHEHSRSDRDDYITIHWEAMEPDAKHNFIKKNVEKDTFNTPYDYFSIMHYPPWFFSNDKNKPTISTNILHFQKLIGQTYDMSDNDIAKLNHLYNCTSSLALLDQCTFETLNICGMIQQTVNDQQWIHAFGGNIQGDHTLTRTNQNFGHYMLLNTSFGREGHVAVLESRYFHPKRKEQCLEFSFKMNGGPQDRLAIWMIMYEEDDAEQKAENVGVITGKEVKLEIWHLAHFQLQSNTKRFRYAFQGMLGETGAVKDGGIAFDNIILTETSCPMAVWHVHNFSSLLFSLLPNDKVISPCFIGHDGYGFGLVLKPHGGKVKGYTSIFFQLCSTKDDGKLIWPAINQQVLITVLDQTPDVLLRRSFSRSFVTKIDELHSGKPNTSAWHQPSMAGSYHQHCDCFRGPGYGWTKFISHVYLRRYKLIRNGDIFISIDFQDVSNLHQTERPIGSSST